MAEVTTARAAAEARLKTATEQLARDAADMDRLQKRLADVGGAKVRLPSLMHSTRLAPI